VVIGVRDLDAAIARYQGKFHLAAPQKQDDKQQQLHLAAFAGTPVVLASPSSGQSALAVRLDKFGEAPYLFVLDQATRTLFSGDGSSDWFGRTIIWLPKLGIGLRR